jgi:hypothetical protein
LEQRRSGNDTINDLDHSLAADVDTDLKLLDVKAAEAVLSRDTVNLYVTIGAEKITIKNHHFATVSSYEAAPIRANPVCRRQQMAEGRRLMPRLIDTAVMARTPSMAQQPFCDAETFIGGKGRRRPGGGGAGSDSYFWSKGDGNDTINDLGLAADVDTLKLLGRQGC